MFRRLFYFFGAFVMFFMLDAQLYNDFGFHLYELVLRIMRAVADISAHIFFQKGMAMSSGLTVGRESNNFWMKA